MTDANQQLTSNTGVEEKEEQQTGQPEQSKPKPGSWLNKVAFLLIILGVAGLSVYFFTIQQKQQKQLKRQQQALLTLEQNLRQSIDSINTNSAALEAQQQQFQQLAEQASQSENVSQRAMEIISRNQRGWMIAEIDYLLRVANQRVEIASDVKGAIAALRGADNRIAELGDIRLVKIRKQLAEDIGTLNAIHQVDVNGISLAIDQMVMHLPGLPFKSAVEEVKEQLKDSETQPASTDQGKGFLDSVVDTVMQIGDVQVHQRSIEAATTSEQQGQVEQLLRTYLLSARLSVLRHGQLQFKHDVEQSIQLLNAHYNLKDNRVEQMLNDLTGYTSLQLAPELPELTKAWEMLQQEMNKEEQPAEKPEESKQAQEAAQ